MFRLLQKWLVRFTCQDDIDCMSTRRSAGEFWLEIDAVVTGFSWTSTVYSTGRKTGHWSLCLCWITC